MNLNKLRNSWQCFKVKNSLETINRLDILDIVEEVQVADYQQNSLFSFPHAVIYGLFLIFCQSC